MIPYACRISGFEVLVLRGKKQAGYLEPVWRDGSGICIN
jgi:hypothetical protein